MTNTKQKPVAYRYINDATQHMFFYVDAEDRWSAKKRKGWTETTLYATPHAPEWQPIETAPYDTRLRVKVGNMTFLAKLHQGVSMDEDGNDCDQWSAIFEGEHPPCWSEGACWETNLDGYCSMQPECWQEI